MKRDKVTTNTQKKRLSRRVIVLTISLLLLVSCFVPGIRLMWDGLLQKAGFAHFTAELDPNDLHIHVIDVGKADAILIESPTAVVMVDTGTESTTDDVLRYLDARGIEKLDAVWISHADSDHAGGLGTILESFPADQVIGSVYSDFSEKTHTAEVNAVHSIGDMIFKVLAPSEMFDAENDNSLVFKLEYGAFSMLFCGDIEKKAEAALLESGADLHADVLKVAHHGSDTSTSGAFLDTVNPAYAVISAGNDRSNLPRNTVLKRLSDKQIPYYRTDRDGTVVLSWDGQDIHIMTETAG